MTIVTWIVGWIFFTLVAALLVGGLIAMFGEGWEGEGWDSWEDDTF